MTNTSRFKREVAVLIGGTFFAYVVAALCGINKTVFTSAPSVFGGVLLFLASRSLVAALFDQAPDKKKKEPNSEGSVAP